MEHLLDNLPSVILNWNSKARNVLWGHCSIYSKTDSNYKSILARQCNLYSGKLSLNFYVTAVHLLKSSTTFIHVSTIQTRRKKLVYQRLYRWFVLLVMLTVNKNFSKLCYQGTCQIRNDNKIVSKTNIALRTYKKQWTIGRSDERGSGISILVAGHNNNDDDDIYIYVYIYI